MAVERTKLGVTGCVSVTLEFLKFNKCSLAKLGKTQHESNEVLMFGPG